MNTTTLILTIISTLAGVIAAYFAYVAVRGRIRPTPPPLPPPPPNPTTTYDVYISYAPEDLPWVNDFAAALKDQHIEVAYDEVVRRPGRHRVHTLQQAVRDSAHGLLVFSHASMADGWVSDEYALLIERSARSGQLFIPVVIEDVTLPEFAATRYHSDFRTLHPGDARYDQQVNDIVRALRERP
ncbi:toll/interleukin-1 receptor domain-containing protein [Actinomadura hibisca]|uniref:toll/interleukin-1 receptor domain-containing protein n=1 Tax=Actinomadura hibisca TaxID=68565 RepID=UPI00082DAD31|nr:toll/interleukin-1 receptor domain-containing protein [Actinomadura hibisca]